MAQHNGKFSAKVVREEKARRPAAPRRVDNADKLVMVANVGVLGMPLAYTTSGSVLITLVAAGLAISVVLAYLWSQRHR
ncbi:hypothetical protein AB0M43_36515 [Longispora sp. NPDC051575]|uniref:hypothetical protein n=1 Tax=Longispora sp. NPDC051575 TaxID=3154943 RepID=UPI0034227D4E